MGRQAPEDQVPVGRTRSRYRLLRRKLYEGDVCEGMYGGRGAILWQQRSAGSC